MAQHRSLKRGFLALIGAVALLCALAASASADPYGELGTPFGKAHEAVGIEPGQIDYAGVHAFAVDPTTNSVYVVDETAELVKTKNGEEEIKSFRIQKFSSSGELQGSASVKVSETEHEANVGGIAIDPVSKHVYMLVIDEREVELDRGPAAGALYAFKTEPTGTTLESVAGNNTKGEPIPLIGEKVFKPQGKAKEALLKPGGIAVDPITHDVIIAASEDENNEEELRAVVERVTESGTIGNRSVDDTNCLLGSEITGGEPECAHAQGEPISPVVDSKGQIYVRVAGVGALSELWQIPTPETEKLGTGEFKTVPKHLFSLPVPPKAANLVTFAFAGEEGGEGGGEHPRGSSMSLVPEGEHEGKGVGRIYVNAEIQQDEEEKGHVKAGGGFPFPGAIAFNYTENPTTGVLETASEAGWIGGPAVGPKCELEAKGGATALIGGGKEQGVFVFAFGEEPKEEVFTARVSKFGTGGEGCPHARLANVGVAGISATANNVEKPGGVFSTRDEVVLSSEVFEADALGVKWETENLATHAKTEHSSTAEEFQNPTLAPQKFPTEGEYKIRETVHTDDLASPEIKAERVIKVEGHPTARISGEGAANVGESKTFAGHFTNPNGGLLKYVWTFDDGTEASATAAEGVAEVSEHHAYAHPGSYAVKLKVIDGLGLSGEASFPVVVSEPQPPPPPPPPTTTTTSPPGTTTTPPPSNGVLSYKASFAATSLTVNAKGTLVVKVDCLGQSSCKGSVMLRTLNVVSSGAHKHKAILTLASGSFSATGGHVVAVTLHLSSQGRALLAHAHALRVRATIVGRDAAGNTHTTQSTVTLRPAATHRKH
jgi:hypothetical protein